MRRWMNKNFNIVETITKQKVRVNKLQQAAQHGADPA